MNFIREWQHRRQRRQHQKYAQTMGLFWKQCPACGEFFGGHEWEQQEVEVRHMVHEYTNERAYEGVCPECCRNGVGITMTEVIAEMEEDLWPRSNYVVDLDDSELLG